MDKFSDDILLTYHMLPIDQFKHSERDWYNTFLIQTDYIPNKMIEAQVLGDSIDDYMEIIQLRKYCREQINAIDNGVYDGPQSGINVEVFKATEL